MRLAVLSIPWLLGAVAALPVVLGTHALRAIFAFGDAVERGVEWSSGWAAETRGRYLRDAGCPWWRRRDDGA